MNDDDITKLRFEYAWKYFDFHAKQRTTMFNFFIVFSGVLIAACAQLFMTDHYLSLFLLLVFGTLISLMFLCLERRNEELIHIAEDVLVVLEKKYLKILNKSISLLKGENGAAKYMNVKQSRSQSVS